MNSGTVYESVYDYLSDGNGAGTITNLAGATFVLTNINGYGIQPNGSGGTFVNAGTLTTSGAAAAPNIYAVINSTGTISAASGTTLQFDEGGSISGALTGAGQIAFGDYNNLYNYALAAGTSLTISNLYIDGGNLTLNSSYTYAGGFAITSSGTLELNGYNFSSAAPYLGGGAIDGPGTFSTSGAIELLTIFQEFFVGGGADWVNSGTITESNGYVYLDDGNGAGTLTNQAGAVYDFTQNYGIFDYSGTFINAGLIEDTASTSSFTYFQAAADSTGTISVVTAGSTLDFDGGGTFAGQINGKGAVEFDGGVNFGNLTIAATTTLNLNAGVNMVGNVSIASSFAGLFNENTYFEINGFILTLSGTDLFGSAAGYGGSMYFHTAGTVTTTGTDSVSDNGPSNSDVELYISGNADWNNTGKFSDAGAIQIGYNDGAGTITNAGAFDFTTDDGQIYNGNSYNISDTLVPVIGTFVNTGTLAKTTGTGTNSVDATIFNTGTISTDAGTIAFADGGTLGGKILASSHILLSGGDFILNNLTAGGTITDAAQIDQTGAITLGNTGAGVLIIDGIYYIDNNSGIAIATSTSSMSIVSGGTFAKTGGTGTATIAASIADNGVILAEAGDLKLSTISGAGTAIISNGASLELTASVAAGIIVTMGTSSDLLLDSPATFKGKIANFVSGDTIDLGGLTVTSATAASTGTLTLLNGSSTVGSVLLTGNPSGDVFSTATDGHGGTLLQTKSADSWKAASGDWTVATDWTAGVPTIGTDATITGTSAETITLSAAENDFAHSLTMSDSKATLDINGTLNLATAFAQTAGTVELAGTINGGTVNVTGGDFAISGYYDTFNNVLFEGNVDLTQTNAQLNVLGNGGFTGAGGIGGTTMAITGNNAGFFAEGIDALVNATISLGSNNTAYLEDYDPYDTGALLTLGTAVTVTQSGLYADIGDYNTFDTDGLFNSGAITGAVRGGTLAIVGNLFENDGIIKISNGDTLNITTATFTNNGTLSVSGSTLILDSANPTLAGTINITNSTLDLADSLSTGQLLSYLSASNTVNLSGTLNNTGAALNLTTTSPISAFTLNGGTIIGGTVIAPAAGLAITSGELLNVTEDGALALTTGALKLVGSTINNAAGTAPGAISVTNASIEFDGYTSINNNISLSNATLFITGGTLNTNLSTGVDATGNPLAEGSADPFWADSYTGGQATVLNNNFWLGSGVPLNTAANMIGVYDSSSEPPPPYTFTEVFTLTAAQAASALLVGSFFVDNGGSLILNGNTLDSYSDNLIPENIGDASYFQAGANTLTIELTAGDQSYDGAYFYGGLVVPTTIAAGATVQGTGLVTDQPAGDGASAIVNAGVIAANVSGGVLDVAPPLFDNQGTMTATNGATLEINASGWVNAGSISVNNATLDLGGSFTTPSFAGISNTGGAINLSGTLNNTASTLSVGAGTSLGTLGVADYSNIIGGTIADAGGGMSFTGDGIFDLNGPTFTGVTYEGALNVTEANINLFITNGISLTGANGTGTGTLKLTGQNSRLEFTNSTTLNNATITFGSSGGGQTFGDSIDVYDPAGQPLTLTLGPAETVIDNIANSNANFGDPFGQGNNLVVNQGTIAAAAAGVNVYVSQNPLTNNGLLEAINGGTIDLNGSIGAFPGLTNLNGTTLTGGTYSVGANSVIELLNNTSIVTDAADIILSGAASNIQAYNGASQITLDKTLATIAAGGTLALSAGRNWSGTLAFVDQGDLNLSGTTFKAASLTVASTGTIAGAGTVSNTVVNNGLIQAQGGALTLSALSGTGSLKIASGATLDIAGGAVATETITFSGDPATLKIDNAGSFKAVLANLGAGDTIDFSSLVSATATISGTTLTVKQGSTAYTYSINSLAAGTVLTTGSDGHSGTDITFFRQAVPSGHSPEPVAFGQVHAGSAQTQTLSLANNAAADGYSEALDATIGSASALVTAAGSIVRLAAGSNSTALSVSLGDSATGTESGTAVITLASDGTGIDGFGTTALPSQTVNVTGTVFAYATASLGTSTAAIGNVHQGATASQMVTLTNTGAVSGGFTEGLDAGIAGVTGSVSGTGTVTLLGAGSASSALVVGFATGTAGAISGAVTIGLVSDGTGIDTLSSTTLASQTVAVTGAVYDYAGPSLASTIISLGNVHVGAADNAALTISNLTTNAAYTEGLDASFSGTSGAATDLGSLLLLGAGLSNSASLDVGILDTASGSYSGSATLSLVSDGALTSGLGITGLGSDTITVTGAVYALASPSLASTIINLGVIHAGAAAADTLSITNFTTNATYTEALDAGFLGANGSITANGTVVLLTAGATDSSDLVLTLATGTSGSISGVATLGLNSDGAGTSNLGTTALGSANITLAATVDNYATASVAKVSGAGTLTETNATNYTLNFGSVLKGAAAPTANLEVLNSATGLADLLGGSFTVKTVSSAISNTGIGTFSGLGAGQADTSPVVKLATTASGTDTEVLVISSTGSNASGYSGTLSPITLTITGIVADVFTLTTGADDFVGGPGNDLFIAAAGALSAGDTLNGGAGLNTLSLSGGGTFDMTQPATLSSVQTVLALEAAGAAAQTVYLRSGYTGTLTAVSGTAGSGITIYGNTDSATIKLGNGNDTVFVGANTETITAGNGNSVFNITSATSAVKITAGSGANTLAVSGGGTVTMGSGITNVNTVTLNDTGVGGTSFIANTDSKLVINGGAGADTITLGAATQTVAAGTGTTLVKGVIGDAGALITANSPSTTTLDLTTGGTGTLNANDTNLTVTLSAATNLTLSKIGFITVDGSSGNDTLTALAANQTLTGGLGTDTLTGYASFGDLFLDTAAGLNGDTIKNFGGSDLVDLTNINSSMVTSLGWQQVGTGGKLTVSDGTNTALINFSGTYTAASSTFGSDGTLGTYIHFV